MLLDLLDLQKKYKMSVTGVLHVGAHLGEEYKTYKKMNIENIVFFEPLTHIFEKLIQNVNDNSVIFKKFALGNENKIVGMNVEKNDRYGCSSILSPSKNYDHIPLLEEKVHVEMKRLDDFKFGKQFNMLNIDVQGFELEVLKGSQKTLKNIDYIMCEINRNTDTKGIEYIGCALVDELENFLDKHDFQMVAQNWAGVSWGDGLFIKRNLL